VKLLIVNFTWFTCVCYVSLLFKRLVEIIIEIKVVLIVLMYIRRRNNEEDILFSHFEKNTLFEYRLFPCLLQKPQVNPKLNVSSKINQNSESWVFSVI